MCAAACLSINTLDLHHSDVRGGDGPALLQVHALLQFGILLVHEVFGDFVIVVHDCIGIVFYLSFLLIGY